MKKQLLIAFSQHNANVAEMLSDDLKKAGFEIIPVTDKHPNNQKMLCEKIEVLNVGKNPLFLLISDNFLKSVSCMDQALHLLKELSFDFPVFPIITDGRYLDETTKTYTSQTTRFERVNNVIQYINHWQEIYLDLRKKKRSIPANEEVVFAEKLKMVRGISVDIGEFLRLLRERDYWYLDNFRTDHYEVFFDAIQQAEWHEDFKKVKLQHPIVTNTEEDKTDNNIATEIPIANSKDVIPKEEQEISKVIEPSLPGIEIPDDSPVKQAINAIVEETVAEEEIPSDRIVEEDDESATTEEILSAIFDEDDEEAIHDPEEEAISSSELFNKVFNGKDPVEELDSEEEEDITIDLINEQIIPTSEEVLDAKWKEAKLLIINQKLDKALNIYSNLLHQFPKHSKLRFEYAMLLLEHENGNGEAIEQLEILLKNDNNNEAALLNLAEIYETNQSFKKALEAYKKIASINPDYTGIHYKLGLITFGHFLPEKAEEALVHFKNALKKDDAHVDAAYRIGIIYAEQLGNYNKAVKYFHKTLKINPDHPFVNYDLALLYFKLKDHEQAAHYYQIACATNPELKTDENDQAFHYNYQEEEIVIPILKEKDAQAKENIITTAAANSDEVVEIDSETEELVVPKVKIKTVLITGATSGIGRATADLFAKNGYRMILTGRRIDRLKELQAQFKEQYTYEPHILTFDVRNQEAVNEAIDSLSEEWKEVDILINNAGLAKGFAPIHEGNIEDWEIMLDTNVKGLLYLTRALSPHMVKRQSGHIINIGSSAGKEVYPNGNVYCASKFAVDGLTKAIRLDLHKYNIRVSQVSPGHVEETEFAVVRFAGDKDRAKIYEDFQPLKSQDVAETIYFIATRPPHVNVQDVLMMGTQQASNIFIDRSGRK